MDLSTGYVFESISMVTVLLLVGVLVSIFVGYNVGGATTGPAFGPAVGADAISKSWAAALMTVFFFVGAWTIGRWVVDTLGTELVHDPGVFTLERSSPVPRNRLCFSRHREPPPGVASSLSSHPWNVNPY